MINVLKAIPMLFAQGFNLNILGLTVSCPRMNFMHPRIDLLFTRVKNFMLKDRGPMTDKCEASVTQVSCRMAKSRGAV